MTLEKYFEKTGKIYGVSSKFDFGEWHYRLPSLTAWKKLISGLTLKRATSAQERLGRRLTLLRLPV